MFCLCGSRKSVKIIPSQLAAENKIKTCNNCKDIKTLVTLSCGHIFCVKCYNETKQVCKVCYKKKSSRRLF